jgi:hypothetical protein
LKGFKIFSLGCFVAVLASCIEPIALDVDTAEIERLVISGLITDQPGPYKVEISLSSSYFDAGPRKMVADAIVTISDDLGNVSALQETTSGVYLTEKSEITGQVGRGYTLKVELVDGRIFQSAQEELMGNAGMNAIYIEPVTHTVRSDFDVLVPQELLEVFVDANPSTDDQSFYRWRWVGTYEILTSPQLVTKADPETGGQVPDPPACAGIVEGVQIFDCTCCTCWIEEYSQSVLLGESRLAEEGQKSVSLNFIEIDEWRFYVKYHTYVEQISLSRSGYEFWKSVQDQQQQGSIFDPTLGAIASNLTAMNNDDKVLGYFGASSVKTISKTTLRSEIKTFIGEIGTYAQSCLTYDDNATNIRPDFW